MSSKGVSAVVTCNEDVVVGSNTCVAQGDGVNSIATFDGQSIDRTTTVAQGDGVVAQVTTDQCLGVSNVAIGDDVVATTTEHGR